MEKELGCRKRIVFNLLLAIAAAMAMILLLYITRGFFLIAFGISFLCLVCPIMLRSGSETISAEKNKVDMQVQHGVPVCFDKKRVLISYVKIFALLWLLTAISLLLPRGLWILVFPPLCVISLGVLKLTEHTWIAFGWKKRTYRSLSALIAGIVFSVALIFRHCAAK